MLNNIKRLNSATVSIWGFESWILIVFLLTAANISPHKTLQVKLNEVLCGACLLYFTLLSSVHGFTDVGHENWNFNGHIFYSNTEMSQIC